MVRSCHVNPRSTAATSIETHETDRYSRTAKQTRVPPTDESQQFPLCSFIYLHSQRREDDREEDTRDCRESAPLLQFPRRRLLLIILLVYVELRLVFRRGQ
jgi:hypothetical protein